MGGGEGGAGGAGAVAEPAEPVAGESGSTGRIVPSGAGARAGEDPDGGGRSVEAREELGPARRLAARPRTWVAHAAASETWRGRWAAAASNCFAASVSAVDAAWSFAVARQ